MKNISASQIVIDFITDMAYNKSIKENMHVSVYKQFTHASGNSDANKSDNSEK
jgi:hypothetical protein